MAQNNRPYSRVNKKPLHTFSLHRQRAMGKLVGLLSMILGLILVWGTFGNNRLIWGLPISYLTVLPAIISLFVGAELITMALFLPDLKIYEDGLDFPDYSTKIQTNRRIFIPFSRVRKIELITIPYDIKCLRITTDDREYNLTKKQIGSIEEIYEKLDEAYRLGQSNNTAARDTSQHMSGKTK